MKERTPAQLEVAVAELQLILRYAFRSRTLWERTEHFREIRGLITALRCVQAELQLKTGPGDTPRDPSLKTLGPVVTLPVVPETCGECEEWSGFGFCRDERSPLAYNGWLWPTKAEEAPPSLCPKRQKP